MSNIDLSYLDALDADSLRKIITNMLVAAGGFTNTATSSDEVVDGDVVAEIICANTTKAGKACVKPATKSFEDPVDGTEMHFCKTHFTSNKKARTLLAAAAVVDDAPKKVRAKKVTGKTKAENKAIQDSFTEELIKPKMKKGVVKTAKATCDQTVLWETTGDVTPRKLSTVKGEGIMVIKDLIDGKKSYTAIGSVVGVSKSDYEGSLANLLPLSDDQLRYAQLNNFSVMCLATAIAKGKAVEESSDDDSDSDSDDGADSDDDDDDDDDGSEEESSS